MKRLFTFLFAITLFVLFVQVSNAQNKGEIKVETLSKTIEDDATSTFTKKITRNENSSESSKNIIESKNIKLNGGYLFSLLAMNSYTVARTTGISLSSISATGTSFAGWRNANSTDDNRSIATPIGFTYIYNGIPYTSFSLSTNGYLDFSSSSATGSGASAYGYDNTYFTNTAGTLNTLAPFYDDQQTAGNSGTLADLNNSYKYLTTGVAPNRVLTVEWVYNQDFSTTSTSNYQYQVKLYEVDGHIEFIYGTMTLANSSTLTTMSYTLGINAATLSATPTAAELLTQQTVNTATFSNTVSNALGGATPGNMPTTNSKITFTPPAASTAPTNLTFTLITGTSYTLNWVDNSSNETGFGIWKSTDGINYNYIGNVAANTTTYNATGLSFGTTYYWKVAALNEGQLSSYLSGSQMTTAGLLSGNKYIGTGTYTMDYATLTAAFTAINTSGLAGPINLILNTTYTSTSETFPILPSTIATATNTIKIYPSVTGLSITSSSTTGTINMNGANYVTFDGSVGGLGSGKSLTIANTATAGYTFQFINDATYNILKYCTITGVITTAGTSGVVLFSTTTGALGSSNNTITYCDIRDGASTPANLICSNGTSTAPNKNNTISNNNFYNWFLAATTTQTGALNLVAGCSDWIITGNSFYQTASRTFTSSGVVSFITISNTTNCNNFTISNNYFGGTLPNCGGTALTWTATTGTPVYRTIYITHTTALGISSTFSGNTIQNIAMTSASTSTSQSIISHLNGNLNITNNTIGSQSATGNITYTNSSTSTAPYFVVMNTGTGATASNISITGNTIGGLTVSTSSTGTLQLRNIYNQSLIGSSILINNNTIGGTVANSIQQTTNNLHFGILSLSVSTDQTISNNTIQNLTLNNTGASGYVHGINCQGAAGKYVITGNTIKNLTTNGTNVSFGNGASAIGINLTTTATVEGNLISGNSIFNLANTNSTVAGLVVGITVVPTTATQTSYTAITKNNIHSFSSASVSSSQIGIFNFNSVGTGPSKYSNNMIRLGIDGSGTNISNSVAIYGFYKSNTSNVGFYHNSIYIGGSGVTSGVINTYAYKRGTSGTADTVMNNILFNARSNSSGTGKHYGMALNSNTAIVCNYNDIMVSGTGGVYGINGATDYTNLSAWLFGTSLDVNSGAGTGNPQFINSTGNSSTVDLHINSANPTPIEATGFNLSQISDDYDGNLRSSLTPVDIGADAGNFTPADLNPPAITYSQIPNTSNTSNFNFGSISITDYSGVNTNPGTKPRCYYKRSTDANTWNDNGSGSDGWKYVEANGSDSPFDFDIDYNLLNGGMGVAAGNILQYFVIAQDNAGTANVGINSGTFADVPASVDLKTASFPIGGSINSFVITNLPLSGTYNVGLLGFNKATGRNLYYEKKTRKVMKEVTEYVDIVETRKETGKEENIKSKKESDNSIKNTELTSSDKDERATITKTVEVSEEYSELMENGKLYKGSLVTRHSTKNPKTNNINSDGPNAIDYATITAAITDLNLRGVSGAVTFLLTDASYSSETYPFIISNVNGVSASNTVTIKPAPGVSPVISGASASGPIFKIYRTNYVTIDGSNNGTTSRDMSITNTSITSPSVIWIGSYATTPITNVTVKNCILTNGVNTSTALTISDGTTSGTAGYFNNITIQNNSIQLAYIGIYAIATASSGNGSGLSISNNTLNSSGANAIRLVGTYVQGVDGATISGNTIGNITSSIAETSRGIWFATGTINSSISNNTISTLSNTSAGATYGGPVGINITSAVTNANININANTISGITSNMSASNIECGINIGSTTSGITIQKNSISNIKNTNTGGYSASGIILGSSLTSNTATLLNNLIYDIAGYGWSSTSTDNGYGINILNGGGYKIYSNSIYLATNQTSSTGNPACLIINSAVTTSNTLDIRNNIFAIPATVGTNRYAVLCNAANTVFSNLDFNDYFTSGSNIGYIGALSRTTLAVWATATGKDQYSVSGDPGFTSAANLIPDPANANSWVLSGNGTHIATVTDDFVGGVRPADVTAGAPDIGAYEFTAGSSTPNSFTITPAAGSNDIFVNGRKLVNLNFGVLGGISSIAVQYYSGITPPGMDGYPSATFMNGYFKVTPTGGSGFTYDITYYYSPSQRGTVVNENLITISKSDNSGTNWDSYTVAGTGSGNYELNTTAKTIKIYGLSSFSIFTSTGSDGPLPVQLSSFSSALSGRDVKLTWKTDKETNNAGFDVERKLVGTNEWKKAGFVTGKGSSNSPVNYTFDDRKLNSGKYNYRLKQIDYNGNFAYHTLGTAVDVALPTKFSLSQNYPNPFNPTTKIDFDLPFDSKVNIVLYDLTGREVKTLVNDSRTAGFHTVQFNASDLSSGTYFYRIMTKSAGADYVMTKKMMLVK
ncbi:MAG: hypothetical protein NTY74_09485 [Ignavibacteriae bacterium]|nr:hypothetical protein [Ignavibacteriota bacterium]